MPELPEVEAVKEGLNQLVHHKTIQSIEVLWDNLILGDTVLFKEMLINQQIESVARRGKFLIINLTDYQLISHLRMEGKYDYYRAEIPANKHNHVFFHFTDGTSLVYNDVRKFGRLQLVNKGMALKQPNLRKLGPEPLGEAFTLSYFSHALKKSRGLLKPVLLAQNVVVGLGNIYVDESLWQAQLHPKLEASHLTNKQYQKLHHAIISVLALAVEMGGSTIRTYKNALGEAGKFQQQLNVYGRTGLPCHRCGTPIEKIKLGGRGTHFCPHCQQLKA
ncbi:MULTISPECIES: DNA-formamidopyrimidine glycosylase [unclassified Enterococcus]|uniref:DNA-formamidopyrimidine glycosylase n=1 Tax=unclassified Enterococcus TaxID=2608891 RepID=UPI0015525A2A|nr:MULTISPECIES: DNA-formamidopyrimidine glycosylase [unclassified Enterococcus]MBS7577572.1 DNA-formamidopyrimidine glycosylase [Enterococcus sp. MMGLQ5-2]MBS7584929.1 DNA-formamidopyrimidine glycosylase [Enterococcus sp. MMGLQ5-1]NPD12784.1 DNA-formamidopyrimidine glycosylase [Enterococcus sp. MMGLQ5-1]NPD37405.1 DNA-formamidopyrimidine glycosylase [Enterococcus sp. MMGLQ5-2]